MRKFDSLLSFNILFFSSINFLPSTIISSLVDTSLLDGERYFIRKGNERKSIKRRTENRKLGGSLYLLRQSHSLLAKGKIYIEGRKEN